MALDQAALFMNLREMLIRHEGLVYKPYNDTVGKLTVGVGRNLDDVGISHDEIMLMLDNDIETATHNCEFYPWFSKLSDTRKAACIDLIFNLGANKFRGFVKFIAAMGAGNYDVAAAELVASKWYLQVGKRGPELVEMIRHEVWPQ